MNPVRANIILFPTHRRKATLPKRVKSKRARRRQSTKHKRTQ